MATILFSLLPEEGHFNPTAKIAKSLRERSHRVIYLAEGLGDLVTRQGFEFVPLFPDLYPSGFVQEHRERLGKACGFREVLREQRRFAAHRRTFYGQWLDGSSDRVLADLGPDLVIADAVFPLMALTAHYAGVPALLLNVIFAEEPKLGIPPAETLLRPGEDPLSRLRVALSWRRALLRRRLHTMRTSVLGIDTGFPRVLREVARRSGLPPERLDLDAPLRPVLRLPEIVLCPREIDFPHPDVPERYYVEPSIDLDRSPREFPWERLDPSKDLIYCSLGSQAFRSGRALEVLKLAIDAMRGRDTWQLVAAAGPNWAKYHSSPPPNVILVDSAPQLELLQRAALMITHGGLGSVKECIYFGVPMIVFPLMRDQPGNAARMAYHGLGLLGSPSAEALGRDVRRVLDDGAMRERVQALSRRFRQLERDRPSLEIIESLLRR